MAENQLRNSLVVGVTVALVSTTLSYFAFRPEAHAAFSCRTYSGPAPLEVQCTNESLYARAVSWDFGDGSATSTAEGTATHTYAVPGEYQVTLAAIGRNTHSASRAVTVVGAPPGGDASIGAPLEVTIEASPTSDTLRRRVTFDLADTKSDHPSLTAASTRQFTRDFAAPAGYVFTDWRFVEHSANRAGELQLAPTPDGGTLQARYSLTSGPVLDQWRGWISGTIEAEVEKADAPRVLELASGLTLDREGRYQLGPQPALDALATVNVYDAAGALLATGAPGQPLYLADRQLVLRLSQQADAETALQVYRLD